MNSRLQFFIAINRAEMDGYHYFAAALTALYYLYFPEDAKK